MFYFRRITLLGKNKVEPTYTAPTAKSLTYNGSAQALLNAGSTEDGIIYYSTDNTNWSENIPSGTNATSYTVYWKLVGDKRHIDIESTAISLTMDKANSSLSFAVTNITVEVGETKTNAVTVNAGDGTVTYSSNNTTAVTVNNSGTVTGVGVGNATITANISSTNNYNSASTSYTASCVLTLAAKFNVTDTSSPTRIASGTTGFSLIEIDGVIQSSVSTGYTFSTTGEHTVKYSLNNPSISTSAFTYCTSLTSIDIPDSVTSIGNYAFSDCYSLTSIDIPDSVTTIGYKAFSNCRSLSSITVDSNNTVFDSRNSCNGIIRTNTNTLVVGCKSTVIPNTVTSIGGIAFYYCAGLTSIDIPNSVTSIGGSAFYYCTGLTSCTIGSGVTSIGDGAFYYCTGLTSIDIPDSVTSIGESAFYGCNGLTSIDIPSGVTSIGSYAFANCSGLISITVEATTPPTLGINAFNNTNNRLIYVPTCELVNTYQSASGWSNYSSRIASAAVCGTLIAKFNVTNTSSPTRIANGTTGFSLIEIDGVIQSSVTTGYTFSTTGEHTVKYNLNNPSISTGAFYGCNGLTSIDIPDSVTSIGNYAFTYCTDLTSIDIPDSVTSIDYNAFYECTGLMSVTIGSGVTTIGSNAFYYCTSLTSCTIGSSVTNISGGAFYNCSSLTNMTCNATTAPTIDSSTFQNVKTNGTLTVPSGSSGYDVWMGTGNYYLGKYGWNKVSYVEIGGLKWATMNIGANSITDTGLYFQWGDTSGYTAAQVGSGEGQKYFGWADYKYGNGTSSPGATDMTKYNGTDSKTVLDASDDAARANWGGSWRMPTTAEYAALGSATTSAWTADYQGSGVAGLVLTDKTDSSKVLFFPAAGDCYYGSVDYVGMYGIYWSSSVLSSDVQYACSMHFYSRYVDWQRNDTRSYGFAVRGVAD